MAVVLATELVRWEGDTNIYDTTFTADTLIDENIPESLNVGILSRTLLEKGAVDETKLTLRGLVLVLLCKKAEAGVEHLSCCIVTGVHLNNILEYELGNGRIGSEGTGANLDILNIGPLRALGRKRCGTGRHLGS